MANAYATIAAEGQRSDVHVIEKVVDANGEELYNFKQPKRPRHRPPTSRPTRRTPCSRS